MTYTGTVFSLKSEFKKIVLTQELILVFKKISQIYCLHQFFLYTKCQMPKLTGIKDKTFIFT